MFLKCGKEYLLRSDSITRRLTFFYSVSSFMLIVLTATLFYFAMTNILYRGDHQFLSDEIEILQNILEKKPNDIAALEQEVNEIPDASQNSIDHYYIRISDQNGKVLAETKHMSQLFQTSKFLAKKMTVHNVKESEWWQKNKKEEYVLMQMLLNMPEDAVNHHHNTLLIQTALDVSSQQKIIYHYRKIIFLVIFFGGVFSILLGYLISRQGLRRLFELTETTKKITVNDLQSRIDPKNWPKELNELGESFNQMLARIESSFIRLNQFSNDLAHELRTPINNLMGEAEIALSRQANVHELRGVLESSLEELNRIYQMIENILFLAQAEKPTLDLQKTDIDVSEEINLMCQYYQALIQEKNLQLHSLGDAKIQVNCVMFRRMIGNLLSNAIKFSNEGGTINIHISDTNNSVQIILTDDGIGISKEHIKNIFQRFYRAASSANLPGIGLGLAIVKSIVDLHQGSIEVTSNPNQGTSFIIFLPK